jgi:hypothetical protein
MDAYCTRQAIQPSSIRFLFDGQRIREEQTPKEARISLFWLFRIRKLFVFVCVESVVRFNLHSSSYFIFSWGWKTTTLLMQFFNKQ